MNMKVFLQIIREIRQLDTPVWMALVTMSALAVAGFSIWTTRVL